jgi:hypothetical protein
LKLAVLVVGRVSIFFSASPEGFLPMDFMGLQLYTGSEKNKRNNKRPYNICEYVNEVAERFAYYSSFHVLKLGL